MRYNEHLDCWCVYGKMKLCFPLDERSNAEKLIGFLVNGTEWGADFTVIDVSDNKPSLLYNNPNTIRELTILNHSYSCKHGMRDIIITFRMITAYTPYNEDEYMHIGRWFEDCAKHMFDKVAKELVVRADVDIANMITSRSFINMDRSDCKYMRYAECRSAEVQQIAATIGVWEQPDFWVGEIAVTITFDSSTELGSKYDNLEDDIVLHVWGLPVCFTKDAKCTFGKDELQDTDELFWSSLCKLPCYVYKMQLSNSFTLSSSKSADFVQYINQQLMATAVNNDNDQLYKHMNTLVIQIVEQLKQLLVSLL